MTSRRNFIKYSLAAGAGLFLVGRVDLEPPYLPAPPPARRGGGRAVLSNASWRQSRAAAWIPWRSRSMPHPC